jgi:hypothetical protein
MKTKTSLLTHDFPTALAAHSEPPCLSLYQPTHRHHPGNQQDPLRFRHLVRELEQSLETKYPADNIHSLLEPFEELGRDHDFWDHTLDGIAVLGAPGLFQVYALQRPVPELAVAADRFHTKPLRRFLQSADRFQVLGLSRHEVKLFEGNRDALDEIELAPDVPRTITEALGDELTEPHQTVGSYGGTNPLDELREKAWRVFEPQYQARLAKLADEFALAKSKGLGLDELQKIAEAAVAGRIATLLIEADREIPGRVDAATGRIQMDDLSHPELDDLLDDLGELVSSKGGNLVVVPSKQMPTKTGAAATCRF